MADVFVSYSRRDSVFVQHVVDALKERGKDVWVDVDGIRDGEVFPEALRRAVEESDGFLFVITPDSVRSRFCRQEIDRALELNKRVVPIVRTHVPDDDVPDGIRERNWIPFDDDRGFAGALERVVDALDTDLHHTREHTRWLLKALEWRDEASDRSFLLRGAELTAAEAWLHASEGRRPEPTALHREYIRASRHATTRRLRGLTVTSAAVACIALALLVFALISRAQAISQQTTAKARALAAEAQNELTVDPVLAILLAREAVKTKDIPEARFALRGALDGSPLAGILPKQPRLWCIGGPGLAFSHDGLSLLESTCEDHVNVVDSSTSKLIRTIKTLSGAGALALAPHDDRLAVGNDNTVAIVGTHGRDLYGATTPSSVAFSPDGTSVAAVTGTTVSSWDAATGDGRTLLDGTDATTTDVFRAAVFTPDSRALLVGAYGDFPGGKSGVLVIDALTGKRIRRLPGARHPTAVAFSPDGRRFAVAAWTRERGEVTLWDATRWRRLSTVAEFPYFSAASLTFSPDGKSLAAGANDGSAGVWDVATGRQLLRLTGHTDQVSGLAFDPTGTRVATASAEGVTRIWRVRAAERSSFHPGINAYGLALAGDRLTAVSNQGVFTWTGGHQRHYPVAKGSVTADDRGAVVAVSGATGTDLFLAPRKGSARRLGTDSTPASIARVEPDGARVAVIDATTGSIVGVHDDSRVRLQGPLPSCQSWSAIQFSADRRWLAMGSWCGDVLIWDAHSGHLTSQLRTGGPVSELAFLDAPRLAVSSFSGSVAIWDWRAHHLQTPLTGHTKGVTAVTASPDHALLATSSLDGTARVWDAHSGRELRRLTLPAAVSAVTFSTDGRSLVTADETGVIRIFDACPSCQDGPGLLRESARRPLRALTALERATYGV